MTTPSPSLAPLSAALLASLRAQITRVGDLSAPAAAAPPYAFLTKVDTRWTGSLANPFEMVVVTYQVQCVALDTAGVEFLEHRARIALATPPVIPDWRVLRYITPSGPGGIRVDRDVNPPLAYSTPQWQLTAQPDGNLAPVPVSAGDSYSGY